MQSFLRVISRNHPSFKGHIRLIAELDDDVGFRMKTLFALVAKQAGFGNDVDAFIDMLDEVAESSREGCRQPPLFYRCVYGDRRGLGG